MNFASLGKLEFLYDGNDAAQYYANGDSVYVANDLSGKNRHVTGATVPTLVTNADGNGNACLRFSSGQRLVYTPGAAVSQPMTFFAVFKATTSGASTVCAAGVVEFGAYNSQHYIYAGAILATTSLPVGSLYLFTITLNSMTSAINADGVQMASGNAGATAMTSPLVVGAMNASGTQPFVGDLYVLGCYSGGLSTAGRMELENMLSARFQKAVNQP